MPPILFLGGASGTGKTAVAAHVAESSGGAVHCIHFDAPGVPTLEEMEALHGSGRGWQRARLEEWMRRIAGGEHGNAWVLLEGQYDLGFVDEMVARYKVAQYLIVVLHVDAAVQRHRLRVLRNDPGLDTSQMRDWSRYLCRQARERNGLCIGTGQRSIGEVARNLLAMMDIVPRSPGRE